MHTAATSCPLSVMPLHLMYVVAWTGYFSERPGQSSAGQGADFSGSGYLLQRS